MLLETISTDKMEPIAVTSAKVKVENDVDTDDDDEEMANHQSPNTKKKQVVWVTYGDLGTVPHAAVVLHENKENGTATIKWLSNNEQDIVPLSRIHGLPSRRGGRTNSTRRYNTIKVEGSNSNARVIKEEEVPTDSEESEWARVKKEETDNEDEKDDDEELVWVTYGDLGTVPHAAYLLYKNKDGTSATIKWLSNNEQDIVPISRIQRLPSRRGSRTKRNTIKKAERKAKKSRVIKKDDIPSSPDNNEGDKDLEDNEEWARGKKGETDNEEEKDDDYQVDDDDDDGDYDDADDDDDDDDSSVLYSEEEAAAAASIDSSSFNRKHSARQTRARVSSSTYSAKWKKGYDELTSYQSKCKNCDVPYHYCIASSGLRLGWWVSTQRKEYKNGKLLQDRIDLLNDIGFAWTKQKPTLR